MEYEGAFQDCTNLTSITISTNVTSIGVSSFFGCINLTNITIPDSVTNIGDYAFDSCYSLTSVYFAGNAPNCGLNVFYDDTSTIVYYVFNTSGWSTNFDGCPTAIWTQQLTVTANPSQGGTVTGSGTYAVGTNVQITATALNGWAFTSWSDSTTNNPYNITMPESDITYTANFVPYTYTINSDNTITITGYSGAGGDVTIPDTINGLIVSCIGGDAFFNCTNLTSVTIPPSVTNIDDGWVAPEGPIFYGAFSGCTSLTNVTIPNSVAYIGIQAFFQCTNLPSITIPNSVTSIGLGAFGCCFGLTNVVIGCGVTSIGGDAFFECFKLANVTIGSNVTFIGDAAFSRCYLTAITVDTNNPIYSSADGVLFNKNQTILIQYPIGKAGSYTTPSSVTIIGDRAFEGCMPTSITIGSGVTNIGDYAFDTGGPSITSIYFRGNAPSLGGMFVFGGDNNATAYYLPGTTNWGVTIGYILTLPASLWLPQISSDNSFGIQSNQFGFDINWASGMVVVVECSTNLLTSSWQPVQTNNMQADTVYYSDPNWTNNPTCFYRIIWQQ